MEFLSRLFSEWLGNVADLVPFGYAFGAGMVSSVNPCGFAMLPAYLGLFLGSDDSVHGWTTPGHAAVMAVPDSAVEVSLFRALTIAAVITGGFVIFFGIAGLAIAAGGYFIVTIVPWIAVVIGVILVVLGIMMLRGRALSVAFPARIAERLGDPKDVSIRGFFIFGLGYALVSLSCTLPIFLAVMASSLTTSGLVGGASQFISYALGMGAVVTGLTVGMALFKSTAVRTLRRVLPYVETVSALLLVVAGTYIIYYWLFTGGLLDQVL